MAEENGTSQRASLAGALAGASAGAAVAKEEVANTMGFRGVWGQIANTSALAVICMAFVWQMTASRELAQEQQQFMREELRQQRADAAQREAAGREDAVALRVAVGHLQASVQALTAEIRTTSRVPSP